MPDLCLHSGLANCDHADCPDLRPGCSCGFCGSRRLPRPALLDLPTLDPRPRASFPSVIGLGTLIAEVRADLDERRNGAR